MINFDDYANENKTEHKPKWSYILDHPYRILIKGGLKFDKQSLKLIIVYTYWHQDGNIGSLLFDAKSLRSFSSSQISPWGAQNWASFWKVQTKFYAQFIRPKVN